MTRHLPEETRREQILSAARTCFIENGYHPTRMEDIAQAAGLSKGGVYFHFQSKREVFDTLVEEEYNRSVEFLREVQATGKSVQEKMQVLAQYYVEGFSKAPDAPRFFIVMGEMGLRDEALAKRLLEMQTFFINEISRLLDQGVEEGVLRPIDTKSSAALLKALIDGVEALYALDYPLEVEKLLGGGLDLVLGGLTQR